MTNEQFKALAEQVFVDSCASGEYLAKLVVLVDSATFTYDFLLSFINKLSDNLSIQVCIGHAIGTLMTFVVL